MAIKEKEIVTGLYQNADKGMKFTTYKTKDNNGDYQSVKFNSNCVDDANKRGIIIPDHRTRKFILIFDSKNANISKKKGFTELWVDKIDEIREYIAPDKVDELF